MSLESTTATVRSGSLQGVLGQILQLQPLWAKDNTPAMSERGKLVRHLAPRLVEQVVGTKQVEGITDLAFEGRDGTGLKTKVPWVRLYSEERSPSATIGWYVVFLFSFDGSSVYLSLNQGTTVPKTRLSPPNPNRSSASELTGPVTRCVPPP
jgi:MrcB-like, N-terminal domain